MNWYDQQDDHTPVDAVQGSDPVEQGDAVAEEEQPPVRVERKPDSKKRKKDQAHDRRVARQSVAAFRALSEASDGVVQVVSVLLDASGRGRLDPEHLAVQLTVAGKPDDTDKLLQQAIDQTDKTERLVHIAKLTADERSRMWRVLAAMESITGSPSAADAIGTANRMATAIDELSSDAAATFELAVELLKVR